MLFFIVSKSDWWFSVHTYFVSFCSRSLKPRHSVARLGINLVRWCTLPRNDLSCLWVVGGFRFIIACVLEMTGFIPFYVILCPNQVILFLAKWHLSKFIAKFSLFNLSRQLNRCFLWFSKLPPVTMMMSSRKLNVFFRLYNVLSIAFWNSAGISVCL